MIPREIVRPSLTLLLLGPGYASAHEPITQKFRYWFDNWGSSHEGAIADPDQCGPDLQSYWNPAPDDTYKWKCTRALDCVLKVASPSDSQMLSTSIVVLGLTPGMLSSLGPSVAESSMLSYRNQVLALLLSIGSPAFSPSGFWTYDDPLNTIRSSQNRAWQNSGILASFVRSQSRHRSLWILFIEYLLVLGAIFNTVHVSLDLGVRSVSTWICESWWLPLIWVLIPSVIHVFGAISFRLTPKKSENSSSGGGDKHEIKVSPPTASTLLFNIVAVSCVSVHIMFGTLAFSSLLFLTVLDAVRVVVQFALSAMVCRFIGQYELMLMSERYSVKNLDRNGEPSDENGALLETVKVYGPQKERENSNMSAM
ncbi:hypothetical protein V8C37DRAFT_111206 [Trichoderma ceciliae]